MRKAPVTTNFRIKKEYPKKEKRKKKKEKKRKNMSWLKKDFLL